MDVPFLSSGALSRAHYSLVRKIETASSSSQVDQVLVAEVDSIRKQLSRSTLSLKQLKECLVLLLYCSMTVNPGMDVNLDFAFPHAINLAEAGQTIPDKRIGYLFCAELMPPEHELQLMLVNTLRKDLESDIVARTCLALDTLIYFSTEDFIPAIQSRLLDLLSHSSAHVRRRALLTFHKLSQHHSGLLEKISSKVEKRITDRDAIVVGAALIVCRDLMQAGYLPGDTLHPVVSKLCAAARRSYPDLSGILVELVNTLRSFTPSEDDLVLVIDILQAACQRKTSGYAIVYQCFLVATSAPSDLLLAAQTRAGASFVQEIRTLLTSEEVNDIYLFMACLECLDPALWAGTMSDIPPVLEGWEVERVMKLLESADRGIRTKTLRVLRRVDHGIVEAYYAQLLHGESSTNKLQDSEEHARRLLEVVHVICEEDGELYVQHLQNMLPTLEGTAPMNKRPVIEEVVEEILVHVRNATAVFQNGCIGALFASVPEPDRDIGPTLMVILAASISEYLHMSPVEPANLLRGISRRLSSYAASIQDACLLSMIRMAAACDELPTEVSDSVDALRERSGRHVRRRCDQFINLCHSKAQLQRVVSTARSTALPDFLVALETYEAETESSGAHPGASPFLSPARSPEGMSSPTPTKLRYDAYEPPKHISRLRRLSSSSSKHSEEGSSRFVGQARASQETLSRTLTPGDLALVAGQADLVSTASSRQASAALPVVQIMDENDTAARVDLIALDSPFVSEPLFSISNPSSVAELDFEAAWNRLHASNSRGWCEATIDAVVRRLQGLRRCLRVSTPDMAPFEGELKVLILPEVADPASTHGIAVLRLKESEDDGCLWRLRCGDEQLRAAIKDVLSDK